MGTAARAVAGHDRGAVALFMAMGGSAYALVITGKSIRNGSITART